MTPDEYCAAKAAQSGSSFYYSFRLLPEPRRRAITALYAYCREVDDVVDEVHDPLVAHAKLAWWRHEVAAIYDGAPQHPPCGSENECAIPRRDGVTAITSRRPAGFPRCGLAKAL